jgi:hypothetical protein
MPSTKARAEHNGTAEQTVVGRATTAVADVSAQARTTATDTTAIVAKHAPAALAASRGMVERLHTILGESSSASLALGTVFAAGLSGGLLLSRAPRLLVALAWLPTLILGGTLVGRGTADAEAPSHAART